MWQPSHASRRFASIYLQYLTFSSGSNNLCRTRQLQRAHVSVYDRLWSTLPYLRPLCTIVGDTLQDYGKKGKQEGKASGSNPGGGRDAEGASVHDLLGTRCDPYVNRMLSGEDFDYHCHSNLVRAVLPHGLHESDVHDVLNVFQATGLNANDQYFMKTCPARRGDYFEFFAEQDLLAALSTCPGGDLSVPMWGEGASGGTPSGDAADTPSNTADPTLACCRPLGVEIFSISAEAKHGWSPPTPNGPLYKGQHGMREQTWQQVAA